MLIGEAVIKAEEVGSIKVNLYDFNQKVSLTKLNVLA